MSVKKQIDSILQKEMTRQQFLKTAGIAVLAVVGVPRLLDALGKAGSQAGSSAPSGAKQAGSAYGASVYEGVKR